MDFNFFLCKPLILVSLFLIITERGKAEREALGCSILNDHVYTEKIVCFLPESLASFQLKTTQCFQRHSAC